MEFKGTKGEWTLSSEINDDERICIVSESNDNFIDVWSLTFSTEDEMRANAKLISAAPKLLAAAIKAIEECCDLIGTDAGNSLEKAINEALN
jgi:hypothetical protein